MDMVEGFSLDHSASGLGIFTGCYEHGNEVSCYIEWRLAGEVLASEEGSYFVQLVTYLS